MTLALDVDCAVCRAEGLVGVSLAHFLRSDGHPSLLGLPTARSKVRIVIGLIPEGG